MCVLLTTGAEPRRPPLPRRRRLHAGLAAAGISGARTLLLPLVDDDVIDPLAGRVRALCRDRQNFSVRGDNTPERLDHFAATLSDAFHGEPIDSPQRSGIKVLSTCDRVVLSVVAGGVLYEGRLPSCVDCLARDPHALPRCLIRQRLRLRRRT